MADPLVGLVLEEGRVDKNRVISIVLFVGFLVVFNACSYFFDWPIFLY